MKRREKEIAAKKKGLPEKMNKSVEVMMLPPPPFSTSGYLDSVEEEEEEK